MNELEKTWLACAIDGEGNISFRKRKRGCYNGALIAITNTNLKFVTRAKEITNAGHILLMTPKINRQPCYDWRVRKADDIYWILQEILPYLIIKAEKAERVLLYLKYRRQKGKHTRMSIFEKRLIEGSQKEIEDIRPLIEVSCPELVR